MAKRRRQCPVAGTGRRKNTRLDSAADWRDNHRVVGRPSAAVAADRCMDLRTGRCREDTLLGGAADWLEMNTTQVVDSRQAAVAAVDMRCGTAERADKADPDHKVGTQDRPQRSQFTLMLQALAIMKARLDGTRSARRQTAAAKSTAALVANSPLKACSRAPREARTPKSS
jgi:hypothetical protein